jgi:hypothetical protein
LEEAFSELVGVAEQAQSAAAEARRAGAPAISPLIPSASYGATGVPSMTPSSGGYYPQSNNPSMHSADLYNTSVATSATFGGNYGSRQTDASSYDRRQGPVVANTGRGYKHASGTTKPSKSASQQYNSNPIQSNTNPPHNSRGNFGYSSGGRGSGSQYRPNR